MAAADLPVLPFATPRAFQAWLARNHGRSRGLWIKLAKKASGIASVTYAEALEVALCWGWIDGQSRRIDETWYVQKFTPRTARSLWSKINCERVAALTAAGRMKPAGLAEVERARQDGRWARAYDSPKRATVPDDLAAALARNARAATFFAGLDSRDRYAVLHRVQTAQKPETRARRIAEFVKMMARGESLYPGKTSGMKKTFETTIVRDGATCFIPVPFDPRPVFGKVRAPVKVTLKGYTYRSTIASMGAGPCIPLRRSHREAAGLEGGETLKVTLALDTEAREAPPPPDLAKALKAAPPAWERWEELSYSHRREYVESLEEARQVETRSRRLAAAVRSIAARPAKKPRTAR